MIRRSRMTIVVACLLAILVPGARAEETQKELSRERIEWCDIWFTDADKTDLPRVLMIGDSIARGYFSNVEKALEAKAYCGRLTTSRSVCDPVFFTELSLVLGQFDYDVIHFNNGLHGWGYSEEAYAAGFEKFMRELKAQAPKAKLVCALSTPVLEKGGMADQRARVVARNTIARKLCEAQGVVINDLYAVSDNAGFFGGDGVHFSEKGRATQGDAVAAAITAKLNS